MTWQPAAAAARDALLAADPDRGVVVRDRAQRIALNRAGERGKVTMRDFTDAVLVAGGEWMPEVEE